MLKKTFVNGIRAVFKKSKGDTHKNKGVKKSGNMKSKQNF